MRAQDASQGSARQTPTPSQPTPLLSYDLPKERWDVLPIRSTDFKIDPPLLGETDTYPEFTRELLRLQWRESDPIDLYVIRPTGVAHPPVVLFLYSYPSDSARFLNNELCKALVKQGFAAVGFVSALTGPRYHDRPMKDWFVSELPESLGTSVHDVQMILNYLTTRGDLDMQRVGMFGQGSGGTIAILSAGVDPRIKAVDVLDPWGDWPDWFAGSTQIPERERANYLKPDFLNSVAPFEPLTWMAKLQGRGFRLQEPDFPTAVPSSVRRRLLEALPATAQRVSYSSLKEYQEKASKEGAMLGWMADQLRAGQMQKQASSSIAPSPIASAKQP